MSVYTKREILKFIEEEDVSFIRLQFSDVLGKMRNIAVTKDKIGDALDNECSFDGSVIDGFAEGTELYLYPDLDTFTIFPWRPHTGRVARLICDIYNADGTRYEHDPRYVLQKAVEEAKAYGYTLNVGAECEFFLFKTDESGNPTLEPHDNAGYFDLAPLDNGENCRRDISLTLEEMGYVIEASHHEAAPGQHEIDLRYSNALKAADEIITFKNVVKTLAKRNGLHATFMPKPFERAVESMASMNITVYITCQALPRRDTIVSIGISSSGILPQYMLITAHTSTIMHRKNPPESMPTIFASFLFVILLLASDRITTAVSIL